MPRCAGCVDGLGGELLAGVAQHDRGVNSSGAVSSRVDDTKGAAERQRGGQLLAEHTDHRAAIGQRRKLCVLVLVVAGIEIGRRDDVVTECDVALHRRVIAAPLGDDARCGAVAANVERGLGGERLARDGLAAGGSQADRKRDCPCPP